MTISGYDFL